MQLSLDTADNQYSISAYEPGKVKINDVYYTNSLIISPDHLITDWAPSSSDHITLDTLAPILALKPDIVLIGTGETATFAKPEWLAFFYQHKIGVEIMTTHAACRTFTILAAEGRHVVAGLVIYTNRT